MPRWSRLAATSALAGALVVSGALSFAPAADAASYRYWSYWLGGDSGWSYSSWGPASLRPADGSVEGWRFGVGQGTGGAGLAPRSAADFDQVCGGTQPAPDTKRVAIIIDSGLAEHAPPGESPRGTWAMCVTAPPSATGFDILRAAASVRTQSGMVCGLAGYPASECAVVVSPPTPSPAPSPAPSRDPSPTRQPTPVAEPTSQSTPRPQSSTQPNRPNRPAQSPAAGVSSDRESPSVSQVESSVPADEQSPDQSRSAESGGREGDSSSIGSATGSEDQAPSPDSAAGSNPVAGGQLTNPDPQITIVSAPVTDTTSGPGPTAAVIGAIAIALLAAVAYLRRRTTRWGTSPDA